MGPPPSRTWKEKWQPASKAQLGSWLQRHLEAKRSQIPLEPGQGTIVALLMCACPGPGGATGHVPRAPRGRQAQAAWAPHWRPLPALVDGACAGEAWALTPPTTTAGLLTCRRPRP